MRSSRTNGGRSGAASCARPSARTCATPGSACRPAWNASLTTRPYYRSSYVFVNRADAREPLRSFDGPTAREPAHRRAADRRRPRCRTAGATRSPAPARSSTWSATPSTAPGSAAERIDADLAAGAIDVGARLGAAGRLLHRPRRRAARAVAGGDRRPGSSCRSRSTSRSASRRAMSSCNASSTRTGAACRRHRCGACPISRASLDRSPRHHRPRCAGAATVNGRTTWLAALAASALATGLAGCYREKREFEIRAARRGRRSVDPLEPAACFPATSRRSSRAMSPCPTAPDTRRTRSR